MTTANPPQTVRLQVAGAGTQDVGKGTARINRDGFQTLELCEGDPIEIAGKRATAVIALGPYAEDEGLNVIRSTACNGPMRGWAWVIM
jgi:transitional endoplasmic reticulum ATPase